MPKALQKVVERFGIVAVSLLIIVGLSSCASWSPQNEPTSSKQNGLLMNEFSSTLESDRSWIPVGGTLPLYGGKLYCSASYLGSGNIAGVVGAYAWVTCDGIHAEESSKGAKIAKVCTGWGLPGWVGRNGGPLTFKFSLSMPDAIALQRGAPPKVSRLMDTAYKLEPNQSRILLARATRDLEAGRLGGDGTTCA